MKQIETYRRQMDRRTDRIPIYEQYRRVGDKWLRSVYLNDGTCIAPEPEEHQFTVLLWEERSRKVVGG